MKFNPSWQQVALVAVLFGAVIVSHRWSPLAASTIDGMVTTIVGALLVGMHLASKSTVVPPPEDPDTSKKENDQ